MSRILTLAEICSRLLLPITWASHSNLRVVRLSGPSELVRGAPDDAPHHPSALGGRLRTGRGGGTCLSCTPERARDIGDNVTRNW